MVLHEAKYLDCRSILVKNYQGPKYEAKEAVVSVWSPPMYRVPEKIWKPATIR